MSIEFEVKPLRKWPREQSTKRYGRSFKQGLSDTWSRLQRELRHLGGENPIVIEAGFRDSDIRIDGKPRADAKNPDFPGVLLSVRTKKYGPLQFACDDCTRWEDNLRAIALTLERLRLADLYGVTKRGEQYTGWKALPGPIVTPPPMTVEEAAMAIENAAGAGGLITTSARIIKNRADFDAAYRVGVKVWHPDKNGGKHMTEWNTLQEAARVLAMYYVRLL